MCATLVSNLGWYPASWRGLPASQMPDNADETLLALVEARLAQAAHVATLLG